MNIKSQVTIKSILTFLLLIIVSIIFFPYLSSDPASEENNITYGDGWENIDEGNGSHLVRYGVSNVETDIGFRPFNEVYNISRNGRFIKLKALDYNVTLDWGIIQKNGVWRDSQWILDTYPNAGHKLITYAKRNDLSWDFELNVSTLPLIVRQNVRGFYFELESTEGINWSEVSLDIREVCSEMEESNATYVGECIENITIKDIIAKDTRISFEKEIMKGINITINKTHIIYENITNAVVDGMFTSDPVVSYTSGVGGSMTWDTRLRSGFANDGTVNLIRVHGTDTVYGLLQFPYVIGGWEGSIPPGSTISNANLTLTFDSKGSGDAYPVELVMITDPSSNGIAWGDIQANWTHRKIDVAWDTAGGDVNATVENTTTIEAGASGGDKYTWNVTNSVQNWSSSYVPFSNTEAAQGWRLRTTIFNSIYFRSSEHATAGDRPILEVSYTEPAPLNYPCANSFCELQSGFIKADIYAVDRATLPNDRRILIKYDISDIPSGTVDNALLYFYIHQNTLADTDLDVEMIPNQTWNEAIDASDFNSLEGTGNNATAPGMSSNTDETWTIINITIQLRTCFNHSFSNCTFYLSDPDDVWDGGASSVTDDTTLQLGNRVFLGQTMQFNSREYILGKGGLPYIIVNYTADAVEDNPPEVTLTSPSDTSSEEDGITFNCSVTDDSGLTNLSLYGNWSGGWHLNQTNTITGTTNASTFTKLVLPDGIYTWNCLAYDNASQEDWGNANFTVTNDKCGLTQISSNTVLTANNCEHYNITADNVIFDCADYTIHNGNPSWYAIRVEDRDNVTINNCIMNHYDKGIFFGDSNNSLVNNSKLYNITNKGIIVEGGNNITIVNNQINETSSFGIWVSDVGVSAGGTILIQNNSLNHIKERAIYVASSSVDNPVLILDNTFLNNTNRGIDVEDSVNITRNFFTAPQASIAFSTIKFTTGVTSSNVYNNTFFNYSSITGTTGGSSNACFYTASPIDSMNNNFTKCDVAYTFHSFDAGMNVTNDIIVDSNIDFYNTASDNVGLYNVTFDKSNNDFFQDDNGYMDVFYSYQSNVTHNNLTGVDDANVTIYDDDSAQVNTQQTNASGSTQITWIREYKQVGDANYTSGCVGSTSKIECDTPHTIKVTKSGYFINSSIFTLNESDRLEHLIINVSTPSITWNAPTPNNETINTTSDIVINLTTDVYDVTVVIDWNGTNYTMNPVGDGTNYTLTRFGVDNGNYTFTAYVNSSFAMNSAFRWVNVSIVSVNGYWLFRTGDIDEDGDAYCRRNNVTSAAGGNGNDVGCLWRDESMGNGTFENLSTLAEDAFCSVWLQYYFDETGDYNNQTIERIYCHTWITTASYYGDTSNITTGFVDGFRLSNEGYGNFSESSSYIDFQKTSQNPTVNTSGNFDLIIFDNESFNFKINNASEFYQMSYMFKPGQSGQHPMIQSQSNLKSFCIINPGDNATLLAKDSDGDGLNDHLEMYQSYTDPYDINTDDDQWNDSVEWEQGTKGYDPYDTAFTFKYVGGVTGTVIYNGTYDYLATKPFPVDFGDVLIDEFAAIDYSRVDDYKEGNRVVMVGYGNTTNWTLIQWNFEFNITQKPEDIETMNIYVNYIPSDPSQIDFFHKDVQIQNGSGNFSFRGSQNVYRMLYIERLFDDFDDILENNKTLRFRAFSLGNFSVDDNNKTDDLRYAEVWVTTYAATTNITYPLETDTLKVSSPQNITVNFTVVYGQTDYKTTDASVINITINNSICTLQGIAAYNDPNWQQNCTTPDLINGSLYNLTLWASHGGNEMIDMEINATYYLNHSKIRIAQILLFASDIIRTGAFQVKEILSLQIENIISRVFGIIKFIQDPFSINDFIFTQIERVRYPFDSFIINNILNSIFGGTRTTTDTLIINDIKSTLIGRFVFITDLFTINDYINTQIERIKFSIQSLTINDLSYKLLEGFRVTNNPITFNNFIKDLGIFIKITTQPSSISNLIDTLFGGFITSSDSLTVNDFINAQIGRIRFTTDSVIINSIMNIIFGGFRDTTDSLTVNDLINTQLEILKIFSDTININNLLNFVFGGDRSATDSITISSLLNSIFGGNRTTTDTLTINDFEGTLIGRVLFITDSVSINDFINTRIDIFRTSLDSLTNNILINIIFGGTRTTTDSLSVNSLFGSLFSSFRTTTDTVIFNNIIFTQLERIIFLSDLLTIDDLINNFFIGIRAPLDSIGFNDLLNTIFSGSRSATDSIAILSYIETAYEDIGILYDRIMTQNIILSNLINDLFFGIRKPAQEMTFNDLTNRLFLGSVIISDNIIINENIDSISSFGKFLTQQLDINDNIVRIIFGVRLSKQSIDISDIIDRLLLISRDFVDQVNINEVSERRALANRISQQIININDYILNLYTDIGNTFDRTVIMSVDVSDYIIRFFYSLRFPTQIISFNDALNRLFLGSIDTTGNININNYIIISRFYSIDASQSLTISSISNRLRFVNIEIIQSIDINLVISRTGYFFKGVSDIINLIFTTFQTSVTPTVFVSGGGTALLPDEKIPDEKILFGLTIPYLLALISIFMFILMFSYYVYVSRYKEIKGDRKFFKIILFFVMIIIVTTLVILTYYFIKTNI